MTTTGKTIRTALKKALDPALAAAGFTGKFPEYRRREGDVLHLLFVQFHKYGGSFFLEFAPHPPGDKLTGWGELVPEAKLTVAHAPFDCRARLQAIGSVNSLEEAWFRYEGLDAPACEQLAGHVVALLPQVDAWLREQRIGPNISAMGA